MFSASLTRTGKWKVKEISYSRQEIVENESQMPLDICFIDDLSIANQSLTVCFFSRNTMLILWWQDIKLISNKYSMHGGKQLVVSCKKEHFDSSKINEKIIYAVCYFIFLIYVESIDVIWTVSWSQAIIVPCYSQDGVKIQFEVRKYRIRRHLFFYPFLMNIGGYCSVAIRISCRTGTGSSS